MQLVSDLLDVCGIVSGKLKLELRLVDIMKVLQAALDTVRATADAKAVRLELTLDEDLPLLASEPDRLPQIFWNLLSNAITFSSGGASVRLRVRRGPTSMARDSDRFLRAADQRHRSAR